MEGLKNVKEITFEGVWGELESKKVSGDNNSCEIAHNRENLISGFQEFSASITGLSVIFKSIPTISVAV